MSFPSHEEDLWISHECDVSFFFFFLSYVSFVFVCVYASLVSIAVWPWYYQPTVFTI